MTSNRSPSHRPEQLRRAGDQLATILESLDLEDEARLADDVIEAIRATQRAYEHEKAYEVKPGNEGPSRGTNSFIFPSLRD
jgi:hypothetical protein